MMCVPVYTVLTRAGGKDCEIVTGDGGVRERDARATARRVTNEKR